MDGRQHVRIALHQPVDAIVVQRLERRKDFERLGNAAAEEQAQRRARLEAFQPLMVHLATAVQSRLRHLRRIRRALVAQREAAVTVEKREGEGFDSELRESHLTRVAEDGLALQLRVQKGHDAAVSEIVINADLVASGRPLPQRFDVREEAVLDGVLVLVRSVLGSRVLEHVHGESGLLEQSDGQEAVLAAAVAAQNAAANVAVGAVGGAAPRTARQRKSGVARAQARGLRGRLTVDQELRPVIVVHLVLEGVLRPGALCDQIEEHQRRLGQPLCDHAHVVGAREDGDELLSLDERDQTVEAVGEGADGVPGGPRRAGLGELGLEGRQHTGRVQHLRQERVRAVERIVNLKNILVHLATATATERAESQRPQSQLR